MTAPTPEQPMHQGMPGADAGVGRRTWDLAWDVCPSCPRPIIDGEQHEHVTAPTPAEAEEFPAWVYEVYAAAHGCTADAVSEHDAGLSELASAVECRLAEVTAEGDRYRAALEHIAGDGGGLDVFLPVETLQGIAREALGGEA